ncbi:Protein lin-28 A [Liparis tanakae]|uniref:Protein lin-28 A n=1 Tax=Liparis tanakae TaxID=230148 RepID=A0A4Z2J8Q7_9TELE|nr:Protein lin-28 A [Liparis tanakae]
MAPPCSTWQRVSGMGEGEQNDIISKLHMEGFRSLREGEAVEFTFKKSSKGLESVRITGPNGAACLGSERRPKSAQKRRSKGDRCYNCGGPGHHAKECQLPPQPKNTHGARSAAARSHVVQCLTEFDCREQSVCGGNGCQQE